MSTKSFGFKSGDQADHSMTSPDPDFAKLLIQISPELIDPNGVQDYCLSFDVNRIGFWKFVNNLTHVRMDLFNVQNATQ